MPAITGPGELVASVPTLLGFVPEESVVVVLLRPGGMLAAVMRVDRVEVLGPHGPDIARSIAAQAARETTRQAVALCYTDDDVRRGCPALDTVADALLETVGEVSRWAVAGRTYFAPGCRAADCCPPAGRAIPEERPEGVVRMRRAGRLRGVARAPQEDRRRAGRAARRWQGRRGTLASWRDESLAEWVAALDGDAPADAPALGRLAAGIADVRVRDAVLLALVPGADRAVADALAGTDSEAVGAALGTGLRPARPPRPARTHRATALLHGILAHATVDRYAPAAAMLGVLAWWEGAPEDALGWCAEALAADPDYRLAALVTALVDSAPADS
ncbi:DUF4192 family protein [Demequina pelophila]|uniref:DUF4192 family protein n=1 Tax=Demequina pelophila TaxID=1638984 RepID=UPI000781351E|nr:DUF4192 family protein [Demequina pelophila]